jgi:hypothetical protein
MSAEREGYCWHSFLRRNKTITIQPKLMNEYDKRTEVSSIKRAWSSFAVENWGYPTLRLFEGAHLMFVLDAIVEFDVLYSYSNPKTTKLPEVTIVSWSVFVLLYRSFASETGRKISSAILVGECRNLSKKMSKSNE